MMRIVQGDFAFQETDYGLLFAFMRLCVRLPTPCLWDDSDLTPFVYRGGAIFGLKKPGNVQAWTARKKWSFTIAGAKECR